MLLETKLRLVNISPEWIFTRFQLVSSSMDDKLMVASGSTKPVIKAI